MASIIFNVLAGLVRYALAPVFVWLIQNNIASQGDIEKLVLGIVGVLGLALNLVWMKVKEARKVNTALAVKATTLSELEGMIKRGESAPAIVDKHDIPVVQKQDLGSVHKITGLLLVMALGLGATGCGAVRGIITPNPTPESVAAIQADAKIVFDQMTSGLSLARKLRSAAEVAYNARIITGPAMDTIDDSAAALGKVADQLADRIKATTTRPSLYETTRQVLLAFNDALAAYAPAGDFVVTIDGRSISVRQAITDIEAAIAFLRKIVGQEEEVTQ